MDAPKIVAASQLGKSRARFERPRDFRRCDFHAVRALRLHVRQTLQSAGVPSAINLL